eukprot:116811-Hanusia_phi.AAC.2
MARCWLGRRIPLLPAPSAPSGAAGPRFFTHSLVCQHRHTDKQPQGKLRERAVGRRAEDFQPELPFLRDLNEAQTQAVTAPIAPVIVLAGPGSGKTRVLTSRGALALPYASKRPLLASNCCESPAPWGNAGVDSCRHVHKQGRQGDEAEN